MKKIMMIALAVMLMLLAGTALAAPATDTDLVTPVVGTVKIVCDQANIFDGDTVTLRAVLTGYEGADVTYCWYADGKLIEGENTAALTLNVSLAMSGTAYSVEVKTV